MIQSIKKKLSSNRNSNDYHESVKNQWTMNMYSRIYYVFTIFLHNQEYIVL